MAQLAISLLGPFQAASDGEPLTEFRTIKVQALLIYLAADAQTAHRREQLINLLWPGMPESSARANLRQILFHLRQALPDAQEPFIIADRHTIQLNPTADIDVDMAQFDQLLANVRQHNHVDLFTCHTCYKTLRTAVALCRGEFLPDFYLDDSNEFEEWAEITRQQYRRKWLDALDTLTTIAIRHTNLAEAQAYAERQIAIDPLHESAYRQLMEILARSGQRAAAMSLYDACRRRLAEELGMAPTAQTSALYEQIRAGQPHFDQPQIPAVRGYELKDVIGQGAYGVIYRAVQPTIGREVAIKIIHPRYANDPTFIRRFDAEAQIIARVEHPYIVPLYDYWREPDGAYLVMRYMRGGSLRAVLESGSCDPDRALQTVEQIAAALAAAHSQGVIHRDIKPANVLLDEAGNAFLSDFGIASDLTGEVAHGSSLAETPNYVTPEAIKNEPVGPRSDIYSLGMLLYEMLAGQKPYRGDQPAGLMHQHLYDPVPLIAGNGSGLPAQVDTVIQRATAKDPTHRYGSALELAQAFRRALSGEEAADPATEDLPVVTTNPYKGLRPFWEADAADFFGRQDLVEHLLQCLQSSPFVAVVGPSGSGKSSAVKAGLLPAIRLGEVPGSDKWFIAEMTPGVFPFEALEKALWPVAVDPPPSLVAPMRKDEQGILRTIRRILPGEEQASLLLVIDQFEELYTLTEDSRTRDQFITALLAALEEPDTPLRVIVTLRADFYNWPLLQPSLGRWLKENTAVVLPLVPGELTAAITQPARRAGVSLEEGLAPAIVADVQDEPGALPLLQYAMTELFDRRQNNHLTLAAYKDIGGISGALARRAEELYAGLDAQSQGVTRQLFLRLVTQSEGVEDARRRVARSELEDVAGALAGKVSAQAGAADIDHVLNLFGRYRLLTFDRDTISRSPTVEVAHEALLQQWPRLKGWLDAGRSDIRQQRLLAMAAAEWRDSGQEDGYLLRGARLQHFESWSAESGVALIRAERAFLDASLAARAEREAQAAARQAREEALEARSRRRLRYLVGVFAAAALLAAALSLVAFTSARRAQTQAQVATSRELAAAAINNLDIDPERSALLALEGLEAAYTIEAENALHRALPEMHLLRTLTSHNFMESLAVSPDGTRLAAVDVEGSVNVIDTATGEDLLSFPASEGLIFGLLYSPDGERIITASEDGTARVWAADSGEELLLIDHGAPLSDVDISADGTRLVTAGADTAARIWDAQDGRHLMALEGHDPAERQGSLHPGGVVNAAFMPDGRHVFTSGADGTVRLWDSETGRQLQLLSGHTNEVYLALSPDGEHLLTAGYDGQVRIWDVSLDEDTVELSLATSQVQPARDAAVSPDGRLAVVAGQDGAARIWDVASGQLLLTLVGHAGNMDDAAFGPDSQSLLTVAADGTVREWDLAPGHERLTVSDGRPLEVAYSPDGQQLATTQGDGSIALRDNATGEILHSLEGHPGQESVFLTYSPDGQVLASTSWDRTAKLWDVATGAELHTLSGHSHFVWQAAFSPDGKRLATAGGDTNVKIWDTMTGAELLSIPAHFDRNGVVDLAYSPDGSRIASSGCDVKIWDAASGQQELELSSNVCLWGVGFSPDGRKLAAGTVDGTVFVWDISDDEAEIINTFTGHSSLISRLDFSPDGQKLATASFDSTARVWDLTSGEEWLTLPSANTVTRVVFSPGGSELATAGWDGQVRIWLLDLEKLVSLAQSRLTRSLTSTECQEFLHVDTCPAAVSTSP